VREGWKEITLDRACTIITGLWKGKKPPFVNVGVIRNTNFSVDAQIDRSDIASINVEQNKFNKRRLLFGDIIVEKSGGGPKQPVGRVALFDMRDGLFSLSNFTAALRVKTPSELDFRFLHKFLHFAYLSGVTEHMQSHSTGIRNLNSKAYKAITIPLPPLPEQQRIVAILDEAFEGIAKAKANAEQNLKNARELFESHLQMVFSQRGEGWTETNIASEVDLLAGFAFKSSQYTESTDSIRLLRGDNIIPGSIRWDDVKFWSASDTADYERYQLKVDDVVLAMDRPWIKDGLKRALIADKDIPCLQVQRTARLRSNGHIHKHFLYYLISSRAFIKHILGSQTGIGVPHISGKQIGNFKFSMPKFDEQKHIVKQLHNFHSAIQRLESIYQRKIAALDELKKSLLHKAFSGEL